MSTGRDPYRNLLRWYPRPWRQAHGDVLVATLRDVDEGAGRDRPTRADAWSLRVHGSAERLTPDAGRVLATTGTVAWLVVLVIAFTLLGRSVDAPSTGWALLTTPVSVVQVVATAAAPALISLGVVALLRSLRVLSDPASVLAGSLAAVAWCLAALTSASWGVGFEVADAGSEPTGFGAATPALFLAAAVVGTAAAAVVWDGLLTRAETSTGARGRRGGPSVLLRRLLALVLGAPCALALGLGAAAPGSPLVAGAVVAAACLLRSRSASRRYEPARAAHGPAASGARRPLVADRPRAATVGALAAAGLLLGLAATSHALWGVLDQEALSDLGVPLADLPPMNLGLVAGSLAVALVVAAVALLSDPAHGGRTRLLAGGGVVALLLRAVSAASGPDGDAGTHLLFAGALLLGLTATAPLVRVLPGRAPLRVSTAALLGTALGLSAGTGVLAVAPLLAPLGAGAVLVALAVSAARLRRSTPGERSTPVVPVNQQ